MRPALNVLTAQLQNPLRAAYEIQKRSLINTGHILSDIAYPVRRPDITHYLMPTFKSVDQLFCQTSGACDTTREKYQDKKKNKKPKTKNKTKQKNKLPHFVIFSSGLAGH